MVQVHKREKESVKSKLNRWKKFSDFYGGFWDEIKRIDWTSKKDLQSYVKVVLLSVLTFGVLIYSIDLIIRKLLVGLEAVMGFIFG
ncbi:MAG: preprotein translocase subunit SecE [Victivallaceae bacterium]